MLLMLCFVMMVLVLFFHSCRIRDFLLLHAYHQATRRTELRIGYPQAPFLSRTSAPRAFHGPIPPFQRPFWPDYAAPRAGVRAGVGPPTNHITRCSHYRVKLPEYVDMDYYTEAIAREEREHVLVVGESIDQERASWPRLQRRWM